MVTRTLSKFCLPFHEATPLVQFPKALKRPQNNPDPAIYIKDGGSILLSLFRLIKARASLGQTLSEKKIFHADEKLRLLEVRTSQEEVGLSLKEHLREFFPSRLPSCTQETVVP